MAVLAEVVVTMKQLKGIWVQKFRYRTLPAGGNAACVIQLTCNNF